MKPTAKDKARVIALIEKWRGLFLFGGWTVDIEFSNKRNEDNFDIPADIETSVKYRRARVRIYPALFDSPEEKWNAIAAHEMAHSIVAPLAMLVQHLQDGELVTARELNEIRESVTERISTIAVLMESEHEQHTLDARRRVSRKRGKAR